MAEVVDSGVMSLLREIRSGQLDQKREFDSFRREILERMGAIEIALSLLSRRVDRIDLGVTEHFYNLDRRIDLIDAFASAKGGA